MDYLAIPKMHDFSGLNLETISAVAEFSSKTVEQTCSLGTFFRLEDCRLLFSANSVADGRVPGPRPRQAE